MGCWAIECPGPLSGWLIIVPCFRPALWARVAAQALTHIVPGQPAAQSIVSRVELVPCFLVSCFVPSIGPGPFGILYIEVILLQVLIVIVVFGITIFQSSLLGWSSTK